MLASPNYIMIGGFLGAGKTTAIQKIAQRFHDQGRRVGLITNDQSSGLVDTTMLRASGFATEEVAGGCFCCRFNSLLQAAEQLSEAAQPDVFMAEPVGSCTDLKATVAYPLSQMYGQQFSVAPLSVMVDPIRAAHVLELEEGRNFSEKVVYIYRKQLEEADVIVINKSDLLSKPQRSRLQGELSEQFRADVICASARIDEGLAEWIDLIEEKAWSVSEAMDVDYDLYAEGEALLGWLNASYQLDSASEFDGNALVAELGRQIADDAALSTGQIAHLKMTLAPRIGNDVAIGNLVRDEAHLELSYELQDPLSAGQLLGKFES